MQLPYCDCVLKRRGILHYAVKQLLIGEAFFRQPVEKGLCHASSFASFQLLLLGPPGNIVENSCQHWNRVQSAEHDNLVSFDPMQGIGPPWVLTNL